MDEKMSSGSVQLEMFEHELFYQHVDPIFSLLAYPLLCSLMATEMVDAVLVVVVVVSMLLLLYLLMLSSGQWTLKMISSMLAKPWSKLMSCRLNNRSMWLLWSSAIMYLIATT